MFTDKLKFFFLVIGVASMIFILQKIPLNLGLDLQGGMRLVLQTEDTEQVKVDDDAVLGAMAVIQNRIDGLGVSEPTIARKGDRQIIVELPGIKDPERAVKLIGDTALMEFVEGDWAPGDPSTLTTEDINILVGPEGRLDYLIVRDGLGNIEREIPILLAKTVMTGSELKYAGPAVDRYGKPAVSIEFTPEGSRKFANITRRNVGKPLVIMLDGKIISAPNIREPINQGKAQISGSFTQDEMRDLVIKLKAGSLPVPVSIQEKKEVGPTLGKVSIAKSIKAGLIGFALVSVFMVIIYKYLGLIAIVALGFYFVLDLTILTLLHVTLTLPGIAGIVLSLGMAVDANVLIFERFKEEMRTGKTIRNSLESGFKRAAITILDSNITTLITAFVLFWLGTGSIKGFAVTLSAGIIISLFTALYLTRFLLFSTLNIHAIRESKWVKFK